MRGVAYMVHDVTIGLYVLVVEFILEGFDVLSLMFILRTPRKRPTCRRYRIDCRNLLATERSSSRLPGLSPSGLSQLPNRDRPSCWRLRPRG